MSNSFYPNSTTQVSLVSTNASTIYESQVTMPAGIYNYQCTSIHYVDLFYQNNYITSFTLSSGGGSFSVSSPIDRIIYWQSTGANNGVNISLVATMSTILTGQTQSFTSSTTYSGTGFGYAVAIGGGAGGGAGGQATGYNYYFGGTNFQGAPGTGGGSGFVAQGIITFTSSMPIVIGAGGSAGSCGGSSSISTVSAAGGKAGGQGGGGCGAAIGAYSGSSNYNSQGYYNQFPGNAVSGNTANVTNTLPYKTIVCGTVGSGGSSSTSVANVNIGRYYVQQAVWNGNSGCGGAGTLGQGGSSGEPGNAATGIGSGGGGGIRCGTSGGAGSSGAVYILKYA